MRKRIILAACVLLAVTPCAACGGTSSSEAGVVGQARTKLSQADCNDIARRMVVSASSSLTDFSINDMDISALGSEQSVSYSEFCAAAAEDKVLDKKLWASMKSYDTDLEKSDFVRVSLRIEGGVCTAAAVQFGESAKGLFGTYPKQAASDGSQQFTDIGAALQFAAS